MRKVLSACLLGCATLGLMTAHAEAQPCTPLPACPTVYLQIVAQNGSPVNPPCTTDCMADPDDLLTVEAWVRCWSNTGGTARAYQLNWIYDDFFSGTSGNLLPNGFHETTECMFDCPFEMPPNPPCAFNEANFFIDVSHPDFLLPGGFTSTDTAHCGYRHVAAVPGNGPLGLCTPAGRLDKKYLGTAILRVSGDAAGLFEIGLEPQETRVTRPNGVRILPLVLEGLTVMVGECPPPCLGACCIGANCQSLAEPACAAASGMWRGPGTTCPCPPPMGACCVGTTCSILTEQACLGGAGMWRGEGSNCSVPCPPPPMGACCATNMTCSIQTQTACVSGGGEFRGADTTCGGDPCAVVKDCMASIASAAPPRNAIDGRQTSELAAGSPAQGWQAVAVTFDNLAGCLPLAPSDFAVSVLPNDVAPPVINNVAVNGNTATVSFAAPIPPGHWTQVMFTGGTAPSSTCLGFLSADVNADRTASAQDILALIDCINGVNRPVNCDWDSPTELASSDADRSGQRNSQDILRVIDALNGAGALDPWNGRTLPPSPCAP